MGQSIYYWKRWKQRRSNKKIRRVVPNTIKSDRIPTRIERKDTRMLVQSQSMSWRLSIQNGKYTIRKETHAS